ncbi:MAG: hypothetical protein FJX54_04320 [Alphaproteobacteria bacterium]|nr:hypothetical protein [Alphaproteobacteria bacterium]
MIFQAVIFTLAAMTAPVFAEEWKKIEPAESALVVALPGLKDAKPTYFDRAEGKPAAGSEPAVPTTDKAGYAAAGTLGVFWYEFVNGQAAWRDAGLRAVVEDLDWIADKNLVFARTEQAYFRGNAEGKLRLFTYRPQNADRPCVVGQYARSGSQISERVTAIICKPAGTQMDMAEARRLIDGVGTKSLPPAM